MELVEVVHQKFQEAQDAEIVLMAQIEGDCTYIGSTSLLNTIHLGVLHVKAQAFHHLDQILRK